MSVTWAETATAQLQAIRDYLARSSPGYAQALAGRIVARTESLDGQPRIGAEVQEYGDADVREVFEHPYRILYRVVGLDVQVIGGYPRVPAATADSAKLMPTPEQQATPASPGSGISSPMPPGAAG